MATKKTTRKPTTKAQSYPQFYDTHEQPETHPVLRQLANAYQTEIDIQIGKRLASAGSVEADFILDRAIAFFKEGKDVQANTLREIAQEIEASATRRYQQAISTQGGGQDWIIRDAFNILTPAQLDKLGQMHNVKM